MATIRSMAALEVRDVEASHRFYLRLGFGTLGVWFPDDVVTTIVQRGDVTILLQKSAQPSVNKGLAVFVYVDDPDALQTEFIEEGIEQLDAVEDAFYGCRQFEVIDPDGHNIIFAKDMSEEPFGLGLGPDRGRG